MSSIKIGRAAALEQASVQSLSLARGKLSVSGLLKSEGTDLTPVVEQFIGYIDNPSELVVPVQWSGVPGQVNGFYRMLDVSMDSIQSRTDYWNLSMELERVRGFAAPVVESVLIGSQRASSDSALVTGLPWHAVPASSVGYETGVLTPTTTVFQSETGAINYFTMAPPNQNHFYNTRPMWYLPPANWYDGACSLKIGGNLLVGLQTPNLPTSWVLSNGMVRITGGALGTLTTEQWSGTAWGNAGLWRIGRKIGAAPPYTVDPLGAPHSLTVLHNDPARTTVRLAYDAAALIPGSRFVVHVDFSLRRGSSVVEVSLSTRGSYTWGFQSPITYASLTNASDSTSDGTFMACGTGEFSQSPNAQGKSHFTGLYLEGTRQFDQWGFGYRNGQTQAFMATQFAAAQHERIQVVSQ